MFSITIECGKTHGWSNSTSSPDLRRSWKLDNLSIVGGCAAFFPWKVTVSRKEFIFPHPNLVGVAGRDFRVQFWGNYIILPSSSLKPFQILEAHFEKTQGSVRNVTYLFKEEQNEMFQPDRIWIFATFCVSFHSYKLHHTVATKWNKSFQVHFGKGNFKPLAKKAGEFCWIEKFFDSH